MSPRGKCCAHFCVRCVLAVLTISAIIYFIRSILIPRQTDERRGRMQQTGRDTRRYATGTLAVIALSAVLLVQGCSPETDGTRSGRAVAVQEPLRVAMELQFPPFEMVTEDGSPAGISVDLARALGASLGRPVEIQNTAWVGLIPAIQSGKADLIISTMTITEERQKVVDFSEPYAVSGLTLLVHKDSAAENAADLAREGMVVAVKSGTTGAIWARENLPEANIRTYDEAVACALEVSQGKADAFIYDALTVFNLHKRFPETTRMNLNNLPGTVGAWGIAIKKGRPELRKKVNAFIASFRAKGGFDKLEDKYLGELKQTFEAAGVPSFFDVPSPK